MSNRKSFNSAIVPRMNTFIPQAVINDNLIFLSGMAGLDPATGKLVSNSFEEQTRQCFLNIQTILEEAGSSLTNILKTTIFMVAGNEFSILNKVYGEFFPDNPPARSAPQVMPFPGGILVSIECIAAK